MEKFKKVCIFMVIFVILTYLMVVIPMKKHSQIITNILNQNVLSETNKEYSNYSQLMKNVSDDQKTQVSNMYTESLKKQELQEKMFLKLLLYLSLLAPAITIILSILSLKFIEKSKKYINYAFISSGALSITMILIYAYGIFIAMKS